MVPLPDSLKDSDTLQEFTSRIKLWDGICCNWILCIAFIKDLGFWISCIHQLLVITLFLVLFLFSFSISWR